MREESQKVKLLKYEFLDTSFSMLVGWAINSAIVLLAATTFFAHKIPVTDLTQAELMLRPLLGNAAAVIFAFALLLAGISALVTAGMAGGTIFSGIFGESYDIHDSHTKTGVLLTLIPALIIIFITTNPFHGLIYSQMFLGVQLPVTIFGQIYLTSSKKLMGKFVNSRLDKIMLWGIGVVVAGLNILFFISLVLK